MPATALVFMFDCYWPTFTSRGTDLLSGRYTTTVSCWSFADAAPFGLHRLWVSVPEPCPVYDAFCQTLEQRAQEAPVLAVPGSKVSGVARR